jgi:type VI secretion system secreted protein Hcp
VYKFADVMVSSYQAGGSAAGDLPVESVSFNYAKVEISYVPQDSKGAGMSPVGTGWDFSQNVKV